MLNFKTQQVFKFTYYFFRNRVCDGNASLYIVVNGEMPALTETLGSLAKKYKDPDGFLYVNFSSEDTMG